jgi:antitoxin (DNA-binding transcriptional repressor) of toxin-antitoxin stability system
MKSATVRDLRLHFPLVEGWLAEGESIAITKSGKRVAILSQAQPVKRQSLSSAFSKRFGSPVKYTKTVTHLTQMLIGDRGT